MEPHVHAHGVCLRVWLGLVVVIPGVVWADGPPAPAPASAPAPRPTPPAPRVPAPERSRVSVTITADPDLYRYITVGGQTCKVPCRLQLHPGVYPVIASGKNGFVGHVAVEDAPLRLEIADPGSSLRVAGAVLVPLGIAMGAGMWALVFVDGSIAHLIVWPVLGFISLITGLAFLIASPRPELRPVGETNEREARRPRLRLTGIGAVPTASGAAFGASFSF